MVIMSTTLNFLGGAPFQLLYDGVKLAMSNTSKFKTHLRSLKFTLDCLQPQIIEQIRLQNLQLEIPVHEIQELQSKIDEGIVLVNRLSSINNCNIVVWGSCCCLIHSYADQLEELNESLRRLLEILRLQSIAQVNNIGILARTTRDRQDELGRRQQEILSNQRLIIDTLMKQHQMLERIEMNCVEASTGREGPALVQVVRLEEVFHELLDAVVQVKVKNSWFKRFLEDFKFTLDCLKPLVQEIAECNKVVHFPKEDVLEDFIVYLEKGVELVYKCSKKCLWNRFRKYEYINSLFELDESLQRLFGILRLQIENDVNQALVYVNKLEREIEEIERSCVLQHHQCGNTAAEPQLCKVESDVMNTQVTGDLEESVDSTGNVEVEDESLMQTEGSILELQLPKVELDVMDMQVKRDVRESMKESMNSTGNVEVGDDESHMKTETSSLARQRIDIAVVESSSPTMASDTMSIIETLDSARSMELGVEQSTGQGEKDREIWLAAGKQEEMETTTPTNRYMSTPHSQASVGTVWKDFHEDYAATLIQVALRRYLNRKSLRTLGVLKNDTNTKSKYATQPQRLFPHHLVSERVRRFVAEDGPWE